MMERWRMNAAERPSFSQLKAKFDAMLLSWTVLAFSSYMTMPYSRPPPHPPPPPPPRPLGGRDL